MAKVKTLLLAPHATEAEIAWAAGLFEGEGCARVRAEKRTRRTAWPYVNLRMCDEEPVREFARIMGFGNFKLLPRQQENWRPLWCWESASKRDIPRMAALLPWLSPRRTEQLQRTLAACVYATPEERSRHIREAQARRPKRYCECGRGPLPDGALGRHRKACLVAKGVVGT